MAYKEESEGWGGRGALHARYPVPAGRGAPLPPRRALHASPTDSLIRLRAVQAGLALGAIAWGAFQLREKIKTLKSQWNAAGVRAARDYVAAQGGGTEGDGGAGDEAIAYLAKLASPITDEATAKASGDQVLAAYKAAENKVKSGNVVIKEIAITVGQTTVSFLTGGVAEFLPDLFGLAQGVSEFVSKGTQFGIAEGANMIGDEAQNLNIGTTFDIAGTLRDLLECCKNPSQFVNNKCTCEEAALTLKDVDVPDEKPEDTNDLQRIDSIEGITTDGLLMTKTFTF